MAPARRDIWNVIATEGATSQMVDNYGFGLNWKGLYDPELMRTSAGAAPRTARSSPRP